MKKLSLLTTAAVMAFGVAAAEAAVGLAILVAYFRNRGDIAVEDANLMKN